MTGSGLQLYREVVAELTGPEAPFAVVSAAEGYRQFAGTADNLIDVFASVDANHRDRDMLEHEGRRQTYGAILDAAGRLGASLRAELGVTPGDRVGIAMRNIPEWFVAFLAITRIGAIAAILNSRGADDELVAASEGVGCRLILADDRCAELLKDKGDIPVIGIAGLKVLADRIGGDLEPIRTPPDAPAIVLFTSGTTGRPKGVTLTQRNLCNMIRQAEYLGAVGLATTARRVDVDIAKLKAMMPRPSILMVFPLFHISGIVNFAITSLSGGLMTMMRRWDPVEATSNIERNKVTAISGPSLIMSDLLDQPEAAERLKSLTGVVVGGQASPIALSQRIREALPRAVQATGWGMTETTGSVSSASGAIFQDYPGSTGVVLPLCDIRVVDADGASKPNGQVGEIEVKGPLVMRGYWNDPEATARSFRGEWLRTGDLGYFDKNELLFIVDRAKDMVISAGENIYCAEVERVLGAVANHLEVALFGVPDDRLGERAIAAVVLRADLPGAAVAEAVQAIARAQLAEYKVPKEVHFDLGPLPRNGLGKIDKAELRRRYLARVDANDRLKAVISTI